MERQVRNDYAMHKVTLAVSPGIMKLCVTQVRPEFGGSGHRLWFVVMVRRRVVFVCGVFNKLAGRVAVMLWVGVVVVPSGRVDGSVRE